MHGRQTLFVTRGYWSNILLPNPTVFRTMHAEMVQDIFLFYMPDNTNTLQLDSILIFTGITDVWYAI